MRFTNNFVVATLQEAADMAATTLSQQFALNQIATKGSCTLEEAENMYNLAHRVISEGAEDLIPENLELPDATDEVDPTAAQDAAVDADVGTDGGDLDVEDLEGIILPDSEGNQYIIQGGILTPYNEEDTGAGDEEIPADADAGLEESTIGDGAGSIEESTQAIEENTVFAGNSSIVANLLKNMQA